MDHIVFISSETALIGAIEEASTISTVVEIDGIVGVVGNPPDGGMRFETINGFRAIIDSRTGEREYL